MIIKHQRDARKEYSIFHSCIFLTFLTKIIIRILFYSTPLFKIDNNATEKRSMNGKRYFSA
jgi:hypothetical protein